MQKSVVAEVEVVSSGDGSDSVPNYILPAGCSTPVEGESPLDFFSLPLTDSMLHNIVAQTNLSAQQLIESHELAPHSRVRRWSKFERNTDGRRDACFEFQTMKRDCFSLVLHFLHLNDSSKYRKTGEPGHDPPLQATSLHLFPFLQFPTALHIVKGGLH